MPQFKNSADIIAFPVSVATTIPAKGTKVWNKAYYAFNNAKQHCTNANNTSYPGYGGKGVKFLIPSFIAMIDAIGFPPSKDMSLDRIDPNGHYEIGNIRWANKHVQSANKVGLISAQSFSFASLVKQAHDAKQWSDDRARYARCWEASVAAINRGSFLSSDGEQFKGIPTLDDLSMAGWQLGYKYTFPVEAPSFCHLPSLTWPGKVVRLISTPLAPFYYPSEPQHQIGVLKPTGTLAGVGKDDWGCVPEPLRACLAKCIKSGNGGVIQLSPTDAILAVGGLEGAMLLLASYMRHMKGMMAMFSPLTQLLLTLQELGHPAGWPEVHVPVLDSSHFFAPDFQIDLGGHAQIEPKHWNLLSRWIDYRIEYGKKTHLGIQSLGKLPNWLRDKLVNNLEPIEFKNAGSLKPVIQPIELSGVPPQTPRISFADISDI